MVSLCFKSLEKKIIVKLEHMLADSYFTDVVYSQRKFSKFYNLIIHYTGSNAHDFYFYISDLLSKFIIENYEDKFIMKQINLDFFYFTREEQNEIFVNLKSFLNTTKIFNEKKLILQEIFNSYISSTKSCIIDGYINFRLTDYQSFINKYLETTIHDYIIHKEYLEYINILKNYIEEKIPQTNLIHLIYSTDEKSLIDEDNNLITTTSEKKYLSDISFSENDFILNSILSLMPGKIIIHCDNEQDNFIQFLAAIFGEKCKFCIKYVSPEQQIP